MDSTEERDDNGTIAQLHWLHDAEEVLRGAVVNGDGIVQGIARRHSLLQVPAEVDGRKRGSKVWNGTSKSEDFGLVRNVVETERVFDDALYNI